MSNTKIIIVSCILGLTTIICSAIGFASIVTCSVLEMETTKLKIQCQRDLKKVDLETVVKLTEAEKEVKKIDLEIVNAQIKYQEKQFDKQLEASGIVYEDTTGSNEYASAGTLTSRTNKMKNKDNIKIRVGQEWESKQGNKRTILAFTSAGRVVAEDAYGHAAWTGDVFFYRLLSCPVLGDMTHWDIVTEEQKRDYKVPEEAESWANVSRVWGKYARTWASCLYRVPRNFDWEPYRKDVDEPTPPAGFRLVTREERDTYDYPTDCEVMWYYDRWEGSKEGYGWNEKRHTDDVEFFAVPSDYVFKKESYGLPMDHVEKMRQQNRKQAIEPLDMYSYVDCDNSFSMDKAFKKIEKKINEIIDHLNKEQGQ